MATGGVPDGAGAEEGTGSVQHAGFGLEGVKAGPVSPDGDHQSGRFDAGDFIIDHDIAPTEEEQPTTMS